MSLSVFDNADYSARAASAPCRAERCPAFGPGVFVRGARPCPPPRTPLPHYVFVFFFGVVWCIVMWWCGVSLSVGGPPSGASWARCARSALNAPSWGSPSLSALVGFAAVMLSVRWRVSGASWARYARSALNAPVPRLRSLLASADRAIGICICLGDFVCGQWCYSLSRPRDNVGHIFARP